MQPGSQAAENRPAVYVQRLGGSGVAAVEKRKRFYSLADGVGGNQGRGRKNKMCRLFLHSDAHYTLQGRVGTHSVTGAALRPPVKASAGNNTELSRLLTFTS